MSKRPWSADEEVAVVPEGLLNVLPHEMVDECLAYLLRPELEERTLYALSRVSRGMTERWHIVLRRVVTARVAAVTACVAAHDWREPLPSGHPLGSAELVQPWGSLTTRLLAWHPYVLWHHLQGSVLVKATDDPILADVCLPAACPVNNISFALLWTAMPRDDIILAACVSEQWRAVSATEYLAFMALSIARCTWFDESIECRVFLSTVLRPLVATTPWTTSTYFMALALQYGLCDYWFRGITDDREGNAREFLHKRDAPT